MKKPFWLIIIIAVVVVALVVLVQRVPEDKGPVKIGVTAHTIEVTADQRILLPTAIFELRDGNISKVSQ